MTLSDELRREAEKTRDPKLRKLIEGWADRCPEWTAARPSATREVRAELAQRRPVEQASLLSGIERSLPLGDREDS